MDGFTGEIRLMAFNFTPRGWLPCDGRLLLINQNQALFALLGTTFGGDGMKTFALPDLRGRVPVHQGQGTGLTHRTFGETGGAETVTLTTAQLPAHTHSLSASAAAGTSATPANNVLAADSNGGKDYAATSDGTALSTTAIGSTGGGQPHENMPPYLALNYFICIYGIFPTRDW